MFHLVAPFLQLSGLGFCGWLTVVSGPWLHLWHFPGISCWATVVLHSELIHGGSLVHCFWNKHSEASSSRTPSRNRNQHTFPRRTIRGNVGAKGLQPLLQNTVASTVFTVPSTWQTLSTLVCTEAAYWSMVAGKEMTFLTHHFQLWDFKNCIYINWISTGQYKKYRKET